jgi:hypothetical protein
MEKWAGGQEATADGFLTGVCTPILGRPKPHPRALSPAGGVGREDFNKDEKFVKKVKISVDGAVTARITNRADHNFETSRWVRLFFISGLLESPAIIAM